MPTVQSVDSAMDYEHAELALNEEQIQKGQVIAQSLEQKTATYLNLLKTISENTRASDDFELDFAQLRTAYRESHPKQNSQLDFYEQKMVEAFVRDDTLSALSYAELVLQTNYTNLYAHYIAANIFNSAGESESAQFHRQMLEGFFSSIVDSGDGLTLDSAISVINEAELQAFLVISGLSHVSQRTLDDFDGEFIAVTVWDEMRGVQIELFFKLSQPARIVWA